MATDGQTNRQTDEQMDSTDALSRSRCRERRLNNVKYNQPVSSGTAVSETLSQWPMRDSL